MASRDEHTGFFQRDPRFVARYGPWAVVTGASDGIGRAVATRLSELGVHVVLVARRHEVLVALGDALSEKHGIETRVVALDLAMPGSVEALMTATASLDVGLLVASAGFGSSGALIDADLAHELSMVDVNCRVVLALSHHFGRRFAAQRRGGLILMSSLVAFQGVPGAANYAATKAYVQSLAEGLALELAPSGVSVLASAPGPVHSGFAARADMKMGQAARPEDVAAITLRALGRWTTVRPGWLARLLEASLAMLPRFLRARVMGTVMRGMTSHHASRVAVQKAQRPAVAVSPSRLP